MTTLLDIHSRVNHLCSVGGSILSFEGDEEYIFPDDLLAIIREVFLHLTSIQTDLAMYFDVADWKTTVDEEGKKNFFKSIEDKAKEIKLLVNDPVILAVKDAFEEIYENKILERSVDPTESEWARAKAFMFFKSSAALYDNFQSLSQQAGKSL